METKRAHLAWTRAEALETVLRFDRIEYLITPEDLQHKLVLQVGVGSGGAAVNDHLTMNGVRRWVLFDPDCYDDVNLVKHPRLRSQLDLPKVKNQEEWILDRNPDAEVGAHVEDVMSSARFQGAVREADLVLCCADRNDVRLYVNSVAVEARKPCITASVFRQGFGGEVYLYTPTEYGCFECMTRTADEQGWNMEKGIDPIPDEEEKVYGLNIRDFKASGLSMDIQMIGIMQARMALDVLLPPERLRFSPAGSNWVIVYNRPVQGNELSGFLKAKWFRVKPRGDCRCRGD